MESLKNNIVFITGASSGIGEACAREFAREECSLILTARRIERLKTLAAELQSHHRIRILCIQLDVRDRSRVEKAVASLPSEFASVDILVNNAGLSRGLAPLHAGSVEDWEEMIDTNVKGLLYITRALLSGMVARNRGHVINIGSIAGHQTYAGGNVYSASKFAVVALTRSLRMDLLGTAVRVSSVDPGLVQTEFSEVRFRGDKSRAEKVYTGFTPLRPADIAEVVLFCATRPPHVNLQEVSVLPTDQASVGMVSKKP
jgi:serine 3-dehydrogenase